MNPFINQVASQETIELMARFFEAANNAVKRAGFSSEVMSSFDLIQAISCFRYFPTPDSCIKAFPSLKDDKYKVEYIWEQFSKLSPEQISDVYIAALNKLDLVDWVSQ